MISPSAPTRHLVALWNPSYAADAMDEHLRILVEWNEKYLRREVLAEEVFVWWARLRSPNRLQPLTHIDEILAIRDQIDEVETHLYLTDYRSLYVGLLADITQEDPVEAGDADHFPEYAHNKPADLFFMLEDIRRLVADDTVATANELSQLLNARYDRRPVSLYGGMVELPLIVERPDPRLWFSDDGVLTDHRLWAEHDALLRGETDRVSRELRENLVGDDVWGVLEHGTRAFLASGEATFRARRQDPGYDFSTVTIEFAKAVETELNALIFPPIRRAHSKGNAVGRQTNIDGKPVDLGVPVPHQTLGSVITALQHNNELRSAVRVVFGSSDAEFILRELVAHLQPIAETRNPAAHSTRLTREDANRIREPVLGIGVEGLICKLARLKLRLR